MIRKLLIVLLACLALEGPVNIVTPVARAGVEHFKSKKYKVFTRRPRDKHWKKYGDFTSAGAATAAANRLRARGIQAKVK